MRDIDAAFDRDVLRRVCTMREREFGAAYDMSVTLIDQPAPENYYFYRDHGSNILAVAHLDTVGHHSQRDAHFLDTEAGPVVYSRALDDRLGAYVILELLPALGIQHDILLTVGEESGMSTASGFTPPPGKDYDWIIEFDRGGTDVVMYQYDDEWVREKVRRSGARVGDGIFSDICYLEHLGVKGFNWGVGYRDYHGPRAHAYLDDTFNMVEHYLAFFGQNECVHMPHVEQKDWWMWDDTSSRTSTLDDIEGPDEEDLWGSEVDDDGRWVDPDSLDPDWIEYPTQEQMRAHEARVLSEFDR